MTRTSLHPITIGLLLLVGVAAPLLFPAYTNQIAVLWLMIVFAMTWDTLGGQMGYNSLGNIFFFGAGMYTCAVVQIGLYYDVGMYTSGARTTHIAFTTAQYFTGFAIGIVAAGIMAAILAPLYKWLKKIISPNVQMIFVPFLTMLIMIPLTGILGGLYAAGVALFQRLFVAITGDRSDAAVVITTLVLAGMFTPAKNGLQNFVDRRFKPSGPHPTDHHPDLHTVEQRLARLEQRLQHLEVPGQPPPD